MEKEFYVLDIEGTNEDIELNSSTKAEIKRLPETLNETLVNVDLGIETTMANVGGSYITSKNNATDYTEMYGWQFSRIVVVEM